MAITLRSQKGSPLTFEEMDGNFTTLSGNTQYADTFKSLVSGVFDGAIPTSAMTFNYGTEQLEGIFQFDSSLFFDELDRGDFEPFLAPIIREEGNVTWATLAHLDHKGVHRIENSSASGGHILDNHSLHDREVINAVNKIHA